MGTCFDQNITFEFENKTYDDIVHCGLDDKECILRNLEKYSPGTIGKFCWVIPSIDYISLHKKTFYHDLSVSYTLISIGSILLFISFILLFCLMMKTCKKTEYIKVINEK